MREQSSSQNQKEHTVSNLSEGICEVCGRCPMLIPSAHGSAYQYVLQGNKTRGRSLLLAPGEDQLQALVSTEAELREPGGW